MRSQLHGAHRGSQDCRGALEAQAFLPQEPVGVPLEFRQGVDPLLHAPREALRVQEIIRGLGRGHRVVRHPIVGKEGIAPIEFDNLRPNASRKFAVFSPPRLFTALGSPITEVLFFVPGTTQAATSRGFGSVFTDVDRAYSTKIEYFDVNGALLFSGFVPPARGNETLSFLGVAFDTGEEVFLVRITSGDVELGDREQGLEPGEREHEREREGRDLVVMDDFIYAEPRPIL